MEHVNKVLAQLKPLQEKVKNYLYTSQDPLVSGLVRAEGATGIKRERLVYAFLAVVLVMILFDNALLLAGRVICFAYPAYMSFKAIESTRKDDDTKWLVYWVVFGAFNLLEIFSDIILSIFPLYYTAKLALLLWCMAPVEQNLSIIVYDRFLRKLLLKHEAAIDAQLNRARDGIKTVVGETVGEEANTEQKQD